MNLAITAVMANITKIAAVETTTSIWEFDPSLPDNRILEDALDVIATIRTLAIKVCSMSLNMIEQRLSYAYLDSMLRSADRVFRNASKEVRHRTCPLHPTPQQC